MIATARDLTAQDLTKDIAAEAWYVYAILPQAGRVPADQASSTEPDAAILPAATVAAVPLGSLTILASLVPRALFERGHPASRTADPDWMAARIAAHHAVNAAAAATGPCLPLAFGTLFSSLDLLRDWLAARQAMLRAALARLAGQAEWAVSLVEDAATHAAWLERHAPGLEALARAAADASEGIAFLMARRLDKARATARRTHLEAVTAMVAAAMAAARLDVMAEPARAGLPVGLPVWTVMLPRAADPAQGEAAKGESAPLPATLAALATDLHPCGLSLRLTGPWPAYAFARAVLAEEDGRG
jgi:hypothetical protein